MANESVDDSIFKILIATDNHLGYGETKPNIGNENLIPLPLL